MMKIYQEFDFDSDLMKLKAGSKLSEFIEAGI